MLSDAFVNTMKIYMPFRMIQFLRLVSVICLNFAAANSKKVAAFHDRNNIYDIYHRKRNLPPLAKINNDVIVNRLSSIGSAQNDVIIQPLNESLLVASIFNSSSSQDTSGEILEIFSPVSPLREKNAVRDFYQQLQKFYLPVPGRINNEDCSGVVSRFLINIVSATVDSWALMSK